MFVLVIHTHSVHLGQESTKIPSWYNGDLVGLRTLKETIHLYRLTRARSSWVIKYTTEVYRRLSIRTSVHRNRSTSKSTVVTVPSPRRTRPVHGVLRVPRPRATPRGLSRSLNQMGQVPESFPFNSNYTGEPVRPR